MDNTDSMKIIDFKNSLNAKLARELVSRGYELASTIGLGVSLEAAETNVNSGAIGVLYQDSRDLPTRSFFGLRTTPARRRLIALIWTQNTARSATATHWVVETSGRDSLVRAEALLADILPIFGATADVHLEGDSVRYETLASDYDM